MADRECEYKAFISWLARVVLTDFDTNPGFYAEVICRKLKDMGIIDEANGFYVLPEDNG